MDAFVGLSFAHPHLLWWLATVPLVALWLRAREGARRAEAGRFVSERLRGVSNQLRIGRFVPLSLGLALSIIALAAPRFGSTTLEIEGVESNRIFTLDTSSSMNAEDLGTSRLNAAKPLIRRLMLQERGKVSLVVFEKSVEILSPLTTDSEAVASLLESVGAGELEDAGSDIGAAIRKSLGSVPVTDATGIDIVLVSDGEDQGRAVDTAIDEARKRKVRVHTILVGARDPVPIPTPDGPLRDESGEPIVTTARAEVLERVSRETGGVFFDNPFSEDAFLQLQRSLAPSRSASKKRENVVVYQERYQLPLLGAVMMFFAGAIMNRGAD